MTFINKAIRDKPNAKEIPCNQKHFKPNGEPQIFDWYCVSHHRDSIHVITLVKKPDQS